MKILRTEEGYRHWCPGCNEKHYINTDEGSGPKWSFNGNWDTPTFTPSVSISWGDQPGARRCHYNITDGQVIFHGDCTHELKGMTVPLPDLPV